MTLTLTRPPRRSTRAAVAALPPSSYGIEGAGATIRYAIADSDLGRLLVAATENGVCAVAMGEDDGALISLLRGEFPHARILIEADDDQFAAWVNRALDAAAGHNVEQEIPLDVVGTPFQRKVWQALLAIPCGRTRSYQQVAAAIGHPTACRAVAGACRANPVALLIPCHRVVREGGGLGGYFGGVQRKRLLLHREQQQPRD